MNGRKNLFALSAAAEGIRNPFYNEVDYSDPASYPIASTAIQLAALGKLGSDGRLYTAQGAGVHAT